MSRKDKKKIKMHYAFHQSDVIAPFPLFSDCNFVTLILHNHIKYIMILTLTRSEMLSRWRLHSGYDIPHNGVTLSRTDGIDLDSILASRMDDWYTRLLLMAPLHYLAPAEKASDTLLSSVTGGGMRISLGSSAVRIAAVRLSGWRAAARILTDPSSPEAVRQLHPFTRATADAPVALFDPASHILRLYPCTSSDILVTLKVVEQKPDLYTFDSSALALITP